MTGPIQEAQPELFYKFCLEDHMLRSIDGFVDLWDIRAHLAPFYSSTVRPSIDPELMIRMLLVGYCLGIRSGRRLCDEVHLNLAYRWVGRGNNAAPSLDTQPPSVLTLPRGAHSAKPQTFAEIIEGLYPTIPKLEMFSRSPRDGWDVMGNEI